MMKIKHLFDNRDLTLMLLKYWDYNSEKLDSLQDYRISSNAVYPYYIGNEKCFLRFAPVEKSVSSVQAELEFLRYLRQMGYRAAETVAAKDDRELIVADTPWGQYIAVTFKCAPGKPLTQFAYSPELYFGFGKSLASLHKLSQSFQPTEAFRINWEQQLDWCEALLREYRVESAALAEIDILRDFFGKLPRKKNTYGLVHYDYEGQNVFFDPKAQEFCPIDFDDSIYHWYVIDVERSTRAIRNTLSAKQSDFAVQDFILGYRSELILSDDDLALQPIFKRYCDLYGYTRRLRTLHEKWQNEPEWMIALRNQLTTELSEKVGCFGKKIEFFSTE